MLFFEPPTKIEIIAGNNVCITDISKPNRQYYGELKEDIEVSKPLVVTEVIRRDPLLSLKSIKEIHRFHSSYHVKDHDDKWYIVEIASFETGSHIAPLN